jgi:hypothetical protein
MTTSTGISLSTSRKTILLTASGHKAAHFVPVGIDYQRQAWHRQQIDG